MILRAGKILLLVLLCFPTQKKKLSKYSVRVRDGKDAGALCSASVTALAVATTAGLCLQASPTALLPCFLRWVILCGGMDELFFEQLIIIAY